MGVLLQAIALLLLGLLIHGACTIDAREIEVALGEDGSIIDSNQPLKALDTDEAIYTASDSEAAHKPSTGDLKENDVMAVMTTLQRELSAVEQMVQLQEKKLKVLQDMRSSWLQDQQDEKKDRATTRKTRVDIGELIDRKLDAVVAATATTTDFDSFFVERATIELGSEVADMKMTKMRALSPMELVAIAFKDGVVEFYSSTAKLLLQVDTEKQEIKAISLEVQDEQPCLVVTYTTPGIVVYELKLVSGNTEAGEPEVQLSVRHHRHISLPFKASAVAVVRASRQLVVAVAEADGTIDFLALNGTSLRQMQTYAAISTMETRRNLLALSNGNNVVVSSMTRAQESVFHTCSGSSAPVTSIAFDATHHEILYAGTQRGEILVYTVNTGVADGQACKLLSRSMVTKSSHGESPVALATSKKYVIAAGLQDIAVFNVSKARDGVSLSQTCHCSSRSTTECQQLGDISTMAFSEGAMGSHLAFISDQSRLTVFHSLLPDEKEVSEFQWTTFVYVVIVIVAVIGSQLFIQWQRRTTVNPWDSIGKRRGSPYGKYGDFQDHEHKSELEEEDFGRYNSLSDELRRNIAKQKREAGRSSMDDDADY